MQAITANMMNIQEPLPGLLIWVLVNCLLYTSTIMELTKFQKKGCLARMIAHITYLSDESMYLKFGRDLQDKDCLLYTSRCV